MKSVLKTAKSVLRKIASDNTGNIVTEFAFTAPILMTLTVGGMELANFATTKMRVQQLALQVADGASRIGEGSLLQALKIYEANINDVFAGAEAQAGEMDIFGNYVEKVGNTTTTRGKGRIIISSLEPVANPNPTNKYKIGWQRCKGNLTSYTPQYGTVGQSSGTNMDGMGPTGSQVVAPAGSAVIFIEIRYRYEPLFNIGLQESIFGNNMTYQNMDAISAMMVRDDRDTTQVYPSAGVTASTC
jgi:Flp pilus assembly protein TadG